MFEDRIAALNQANIEKMAMGAMQYDTATMLSMVLHVGEPPKILNLLWLQSLRTM